MKNSKFWLAVGVAGVALNILDIILQGMVMQNLYYAKHADVFNQATNPVWFVVGDFLSIFILVWVYDKVAGSFSSGWKGGAMFGLYTGILINFPTWIFVHLWLLKGFSYHFAWFSTIYGIVWTVIAGALIAIIYKKAPTAPAA
ncbi:MAG: hypothetical protein WBW71_10770 [Bacteroidota bacterium]